MIHHQMTGEMVAWEDNIRVVGDPPSKMLFPCNLHFDNWLSTVQSTSASSQDNSWTARIALSGH